MQERHRRNRLARETSPYLLQHKDNPVHWRAWGPEALAEAKATGKPILLSVGYAACHWCHVMAHESFEDAAIAAVMNELFVNIKVDREERPDVDAIYMGALHALGEQGGWPLTMFLTATPSRSGAAPISPRRSATAGPSFVRVLNEVARIYRDEPDKVRQNADVLKDRLKPQRRHDPAAPPPEATAGRSRGPAGAGGRSGQWRHQGRAEISRSRSSSSFLWRAGLRYGLPNPLEAVDLTLTQIAQGGIYDHLGGGFARYSVDERWLVPHFEKMLYDNAQLIEMMTQAWREKKSPLYKLRIEETVGWLLREMVAEGTSPQGGGFASSLDADSEGEEGKFYVWSLAEIEDALGPDDAKLFAEIYGVTAGGNFEGHTILNRLGSIELRDAGTEARVATMRETLSGRRAGRVRPGFDDKVLADWNGLMIAALANAADAFDRPDWLEAAERAFDFICTRISANGPLLHAYRNGEAKAPATANDYANMIKAALALANVTGNPEYVERAKAWAEMLDQHYWSENLGGYYFTADDTSDLIVRPFSGQDEATPNANGTMVSNLVALHLWTGEGRYRDRADAILRGFAGTMTSNVLAHAGLLASSLDLMAPAHIVLIAPKGKSTHALRRALADVSLPGAVVQEVREGESLPASSPAHGKTALEGKPTAYVCIGPQCSLPVTEPAELVETVKAARQVIVA